MPLRQFSLLAILLSASASLFGQVPPRMVSPEAVPVYNPQQQQPQPQNPAPNQPGQPNAAAPAQAAPGQAAPGRPLASNSPFQLGGVSLTEMIDLLAKEMKINYILDPRVQGKVTIYTYGEVKPVDYMPLLEMLLRINGATIVKVGEFYRIIPIAAIGSQPVPPVMNADSKTLPDDERMVLNMIFLKYATAAEMDKLLSPFYGEGAKSTVYEAANLLILHDNARSMKRTMDLLALFDSQTFANQRVRLYEIEHALPSELAVDLQTVFKAYGMTDKTSVRFLPVDRISTLIAVSPNPGVFEDVQKWIAKLDVQAKISEGAVNNYVYRLKYSRAETVAFAVMALYSGNPFALSMLAAATNMGGGGMGGYGGGGYGGYGGYGGGAGYGGYGGGYGNNPYAAMGMMGMGGYGYGMNPYAGAMGMGGFGYGGMGATQGYAPANTGTGIGNQQTTGAPGQTGGYLNNNANAQPQRIPHVIPNPFDNTLLVQANPQEWEQITSLLRQLDVAPRQVLIDAKIYELDLTGAFSSGVQAYLEKRDSGGSSSGSGGGSGIASRILTAASNGGLALSAGALVLRSHELLVAVSAAEAQQKSRIISSPSIIATDSIPAIMNVGQDVPVLTSTGTAVTGSAFNSVSSRSTGTTLSVIARVSASGIVTMVIDQEVSQPISTTTSGIGSPSFSQRHFTTQMTVQDGDTVALGGFIQESMGSASQGIPGLHRIPILGAAFGSKTYSKARTELVVFLTPRVIYDAAQILDATEEIKGNLKKIQKFMKD
jgi:general secretion pathway protein D